MKLKYLAMLFLVFFLILGSASAIDGVSYFDRDTTFCLDRLDFTIPEGYGPVRDKSIHTIDNGVRKDSEIFVNEEGDILFVCVFSGDIDTNIEHYVPEGQMSEKQTIKGHEGILYREFGFYDKYFVYEDGGRVVIVKAYSTSEIEDMIPR